MNFQPTDYLADLNLEFDAPTMSPIEEVNKADLDLFTQTEFFDLDVFSSDLAPQTKEQQLQQHLQQQQQQQPQQHQQLAAKVSAASPQVKTEYSQEVRHGSVDSEYQFVDFAYNMSTPSAVASSVLLDDAPQEDINEIKRKRNTAASARFRIKKKLKEKQMEQQAAELRDRLAFLEKRLKTLEMENKCLKQLMIEKNEKKNSDLLESIKKRSLVEGENKSTN